MVQSTCRHVNVSCTPDAICAGRAHNLTALSTTVVQPAEGRESLLMGTCCAGDGVLRSGVRQGRIAATFRKKVLIRKSLSPPSKVPPEGSNSSSMCLPVTSEGVRAVSVATRHPLSQVHGRIKDQGAAQREENLVDPPQHQVRDGHLRSGRNR